MKTLETRIEKTAFSIAEASERVSLSKSFLRLEIRRGNLAARKIGRRVLILDADLKKYIASATVA